MLMLMLMILIVLDLFLMPITSRSTIKSTS